MITEDHVSFETAKLLKEKGFDEKCRTFYTVWFDEEVEGPTEDRTENWNIEPRYFSAPTLQMAMKWLREKQIFIQIGFCDYLALHKSEWIPEVCTHDSILDEPSIAYSTYEEACEAAIRYSLENLI